ncbi:MAG: hypothetical protein LH631_09195, partial [Alkalinema sp. CAN_BIN05]|nr:hypothetical protein [Alkalinema sp. CAN_BIN05]
SMSQDSANQVNLDSYRVFSQLRPRHLVPEEVMEMHEPELDEPELDEPEIPVLSEVTIDREAFLF